MSVQVWDGHGHPVPLGGELGRGGEGVVYAVPSRPDLVAKVYHKPTPTERADKLRAMSNLQTDRLLKVAAWPVDTLTDRSGGPVVGLLMPKVEGYKPIHMLYGPRSRFAEFPKATFPFLVHAASNLSRAVAVVHAHGHVVGDINHDNIVVSQQATVQLIDCDSFQVSASRRRYLCDVGVSTHQPPEMLALSSFHGVTRTPNQDNFGLAVLIFQLLMMGRHPFSGRYAGGGEMPIERAIEELRFAYGASAVAHQMSPPPYSLQVDALSTPVVSLFERAFLVDGRGPARPTADEWVSTLDTFAKSLRQCTRNPSHSFLAVLSSCPLCLVEAGTGRHLFAVVRAAATTPGRAPSTFDITIVWSEIAAVPSPGPAPALPSYRSLRVRASPEAVRRGRKRRARNVLAILLAVVGAVAWARGVPLAGGAGFWSFAFLAGIGFFAVADRHNLHRVAAKGQLDAARSAWAAVQERWHFEAGEGAFATRRQELENARKELEQLPATHQERLRKLETDRRAREFQQHLERHRLIRARIDNIGPGRTATLSSYGIESAADVSYSAIISVPGFGPTLTGNLVAWRQRVEASFRFDPNKGVDPQDIAALESEIASTQARLEQTLRSGALLLRSIAADAPHKRQTLRPEVDRCLDALARAEAEWRAL